jgi:hypothetical protein
MEKEKKAISLNAMPSKFRGDTSKESDLFDDTEIWIDQFKNAAAINGWSDSESILVLGSWLEGKALRWLFESKKTEVAKTWTFDNWLKELLEAFPVEESATVKDSDTYSVFGLARLYPFETETISQFHVRFNAYLKRIDKEMYTKGFIQECYLKTLRAHREQIWLLIATNQSFTTLDQIMTEASRIDKVLQFPVSDSLPVSPPPGASVTEKHLKTAKTVTSTDVQLLDLQKQLQNLTLLVNQKTERREEKTCFRCHRTGHIASDKEFHPDYVRRSPATGANAEPLGRPNNDSTNYVKLVEHVIQTESDLMSVKRIRVEDLINNSTSTSTAPTVKRIKSTTKSATQPKVSRQTKCEESPLISRVMDTKLDISFRDVVKSNPRVITEFIKVLQSKKRTKAKSVSFFDVSSTQKPTHIIGKINNQDIGIYVDCGSTFCIVSSSCLKRIDIAPACIEKLKKPILLQPVNGIPLESVYFAKLDVMFDDVTFRIPFLILEEMACEIMIGIDKLKEYESLLDYGNDCLTIHSGDKEVRIQLYSKSELNDLLNSDLEDDDSSSSDEEDDPPLFLLRAVQEEFISDVAPLMESEQELILISDSIPPEFKDATSSLFCEFSYLFAQDFSEIPGIDSAPYSLTLVSDDVKPVTSRLQRYNPMQRDAIKQEIDKMLESGVIEPSNSPWSFPIVLVPKPDLSIRFCINYKKLNDLTVKDKFPLPRIDDCLDSLSGKTIFTTLDCFAGYWQILGLTLHLLLYILCTT